MAPFKNTSLSFFSLSKQSVAKLKSSSLSENFLQVLRRVPECNGYRGMVEGRGTYRVLVGKPEGKRPLGRPRRRWVDNIGMNLQEVGCGCVDWIGLAQDRDRWRTLVSAVMNLRVP